MIPRPGILLGWHNLTHNRVRFVLFAAGVCFSVLLMFTQLGFRNSLLDSNVQLIEHLKADLVLVSRNEATLVVRETFSRRRLAQAAAVPGVRSVYPLYLDYQHGILRNTHRKVGDREPSRAIRVVGVDPEAYLLDIPELDPRPQPGRPHPAVLDLKEVGKALYDSRGRPQSLYDSRGRPHERKPDEQIYGPMRAYTLTQLAQRDIELVGGFPLGFDFGAEGTLVVSYETFADYLRRPDVPGWNFEEVELGLIRLEDPGRDLLTVRDKLRGLFSEKDVDVLTRPELCEREKTYWVDNTAIGFMFGFGMWMGFLVGLVICFQILTSDVKDHLPQYATLRAIGYPNSYLTWVVIQEALLLALIGFVPGWLISWAVYRWLTWYSGLPMMLDPVRVLCVLGLTVLMCLLSGLAALQEVKNVDPADVFG